MNETYSIKTYINWQALNAKFDVLGYEAGKAVGRALEAARHDPAFYAGDIGISFSVGPPPKATAPGPDEEGK